MYKRNVIELDIVLLPEYFWGSGFCLPTPRISCSLFHFTCFPFPPIFPNHIPLFQFPSFCPQLTSSCPLPPSLTPCFKGLFLVPTFSSKLPSLCSQILLRLVPGPTSCSLLPLNPSPLLPPSLHDPSLFDPQYESTLRNLSVSAVVRKCIAFLRQIY